MGSSESRHDTFFEEHIGEQARVKAYNEELQRKRVQVEEEKMQWLQQQIREQYWKESQLREEQKRKEAALEWLYQAHLRTLKLQQQAIQKKFQEQKVLEELMKVKLQKQLGEQQLQNAILEQQQLRLQQIQHQHTQLYQVCAPVAAAATPLACFGMKETVAMQKKASLSTTTSAPIVPRKTVVEQRRVFSDLAASRASSIGPGARTWQQEVSSSSVTIHPSSIDPETLFARQKTAPPAQRIAKNFPKVEKTPPPPFGFDNKNVKCNEWSIIEYMRDQNSISERVSKILLELFNDNETIPFIARYRRHLTRGMDEDKLREVRHSFDQAKSIKQRAVTIVQDIDNKGLWTPQFHALVLETKSLEDLEHINSVFQAPKSKIAQTATANGLGILADECLRHKTPPLAHAVQESVEGLKTQEQVKDGIIRLLADIIIKDRRTFSIINKLCSTHQFEVQTTKGKGADKLNKDDNTYGLYYNYTSSQSDLKPEEIRDINRGASLKALSVKINIPEEFGCEFKKQCLERYGFIEYGPSLEKTIMAAAIDFAYNRWIKGFVAKKVRNEISTKAAKADYNRLAHELKAYLLAPPVSGKTVIGISPGFKNCCTFAVLCALGNVLETGKIFPNNRYNPQDINEAKRVLSNLICKHKCKIIALGNGNARKEMEVFLQHVIKKDKKVPSDVFYTIVDKPSPSIYSCSRETAMELTGVEADISSAVSIARRLQDPMAELVKIEPEQLTAEKHLQQMYRQLTVELVSYVGVDVNTASVSLLKNVAGLDEAKARSIIEWRTTFGPFTNRNDLLKVKGIDKKTFEQCAGFIRIVPETAVAISGKAIPQDSFNYLDQTWIHPESYDIANSFLEAAKCNVLELGTGSFIFTLSLFPQSGFSDLAKSFGTTEETIEMILQGLRIVKGQDIRGKGDK